MKTNKPEQKPDRRRRKALTVFAAAAAVIAALLYYEQVAVIYVLATVGLTLLLIVVATADLASIGRASGIEAEEAKSGKSVRKAGSMNEKPQEEKIHVQH